MNDKFGIAMIYPTVTGGREYYINMAATTLTQLEDGGMVDRMPSNTTRNSDGSWRIYKSETPRWVITTPSGAKPWRNVEMTAQMKLVDAGSGSYLQMYCRGEQHSTTLSEAWHGTANKARMRFDGAFGFIKELYHESNNSGYASAVGYTASGLGNILNKWVTWKFICYNINNDTQTKLEVWVDVANNNTFKKVIEYTDTGNWNASSGFSAFMTKLKGLYTTKPPIPYNRDKGTEMKQNEIITWGGNYVSFRSDNSTYDFKNVSVREITTSAPTDVTAPTLTITSPTKGQVISGSTITFAGTASDSESGVAKVEASVDGGQYVLANGTTSWTFTTTISTANHTVTVKATDKVGNSTVTSLTFTPNVSFTVS